VSLISAHGVVIKASGDDAKMRLIWSAPERLANTRIRSLHQFDKLLPEHEDCAPSM